MRVTLAWPEKKSKLRLRCLTESTIKVRGPDRKHKLHQTKAYRYDLADVQGKKHEVRAVGMDSIAVMEQASGVENLVN